MKCPLLPVVVVAALPFLPACSKKEPVASAPEAAAPAEATTSPAPGESRPETDAGLEGEPEAGGAGSPFEKARERDRLTQSMASGKQIYLAVITYASDHEDRFPASLKELVPVYLLDANAIASKGLDVPADEQWVYLPEGKTASSNGNLPLLVLDGERNGQSVVITISGAVQTMEPDKARALIEPQR